MIGGKSCFFIGHKEADERVLPRQESEIERLILKENVSFFYIGGYGEFDRVAAMAVKKAKQKFPDINSLLGADLDLGTCRGKFIFHSCVLQMRCFRQMYK